jgi:hypothetical protein
MEALVLKRILVVSFNLFKIPSVKFFGYEMDEINS